MSVDLIGWITIVFGMLMLQVPAGVMISMFAFALLFQAAAAVRMLGIGITPSHLSLIVFVYYLWKQGFSFAPLRQICRPSNAGFWIVVLAFYCLLTGIFLPRLFQGFTDINPIGTTAFDKSDAPVPLGPSSGNITQSIYMFGSTIVFLGTSLFLRNRQAIRQVVVALLVYSAGNIFFGLVDLVSYATGTGYVLDFIHNGNYTLHVNEAVIGFKRIAGSFSEAAAFAGATLGALGFTLGLYIGGLYTGVALILSLVEIVMLILSTSSTGYVGLAAVVGAAYWLAIKNIVQRRVTYSGLLFAVFTPLVAASVLVAVLIDHEALSWTADMLQTVIFDKAGSSSAMERQALNLQALTNVVDTFGIGAGNGSVRTSSFPLAVLANLGIAGVVIYGTLLIMVFFKGRREAGASFERTVQAAARLAAFGLLAGACISGTLVDLGLPFFVFAAVCCSVDAPSRDTRVRRYALELQAA